MAISSVTLKKLFALSGNECAFPRCRLPIYDTDEDVITAEICHIKGKSTNGPRYDPNQTESERNGYPNLILMCSPHNKIVDDPKNVDEYTVEVLTKYKRKHEARYKNTVVQAALLERFVNSFRSLLPAPPPWAVKLKVAFLRIDPTGWDEYGLEVVLTNESTGAVENPRLYVMFPSAYRVAPLTVSLKWAGRSKGQTGVLLQPLDFLPGESIGLRVLFSPSTWKRELQAHKLQITLRSGKKLVYRTQYSLGLLLEGLRPEQFRL